VQKSGNGEGGLGDRSVESRRAEGTSSDSGLGLDPRAYYRDFALAFVRGRLHRGLDVPEEQLLDEAATAELRLHRFKRNAELPRVRRVLGTLSGLQPTSLLDVGSGRGTFLWPLLDTFPQVSVLAVDRDPRRAADLGSVSRGGVTRLDAARMDATHLALADGSFDVVTVLEVLEHMEDPQQAALEIVRASRRFVIATVPSREDDNPEHVQLFTRERLGELFQRAGAVSVKVDGVRSHLVLLARVA